MRNDYEFDCRGKTYLFDEFLQQWVDKLKAGNQTHMGLRLMKDIESFKVN